MALILNIETSTDVCSVSVSEDGACKFLKLHIPDPESGEKSSHSKLLAVFMQQILTENSILTKSINAVAISGGPGSYTGLRIGVSTAKGFATALDLPLIVIDTLKVVAAMAKSKINFEYDYIIPMTDARRMEVYCSVYDKNLKQISPVEAKVIDETSFSEYAGKRLVFCGNGAEKCSEILKAENHVFLDGVFASAEFMSGFSCEKFNGKDFVDLVYYEPFYLKDFVATTPRNKVF